MDGTWAYAEMERLREQVRKYVIQVGELEYAVGQLRERLKYNNLDDTIRNVTHTHHDTKQVVVSANAGP